MWEWLIPLLIVVAILILLGVYFWVSYRSLKGLDQKVDESWQLLNEQLSRRAQSVPALISSVREYAPHEAALFAQVNTAHESSIGAASPLEAALSASQLQSALQSLLAVTDGYPKLMVEPSFLSQQAIVSEANEQIQIQRRNYNGGVREYNSKLRSFPNRLYAHRLGHSEKDFFEVTGVKLVADAPKIQF